MFHWRKINASVWSRTPKHQSNSKTRSIPSKKIKTCAVNLVSPGRLTQTCEGPHRNEFRFAVRCPSPSRTCPAPRQPDSSLQPSVLIVPRLVGWLFVVRLTVERLIYCLPLALIPLPCGFFLQSGNVWLSWPATYRPPHFSDFWILFERRRWSLLFLTSHLSPFFLSFPISLEAIRKGG